MEVILTKATNSNITYGEQQVLEVERLTGVSKIEYDASGTIPLYDIYHTTNGHDPSVATHYGADRYILTIVPYMG